MSFLTSKRDKGAGTHISLDYFSSAASAWQWVGLALATIGIEGFYDCFSNRFQGWAYYPIDRELTRVSVKRETKGIIRSIKGATAR